MIDAIVVMGVSGSGKSTLARALAHELRWTFVEGDDLHPPANIAKMAAGIPLDDADRAPFLANVAHAMARQDGVVVACSALKRRYRDVLRAGGQTVAFVMPIIDESALAARMRRRAGHFMPASLLASQLATLEPPTPDENAILVDGGAPIEAQVTAVIEDLADLAAAS